MCVYGIILNHFILQDIATKSIEETLNVTAFHIGVFLIWGIGV